MLNPKTRAAKLGEWAAQYRLMRGFQRGISLRLQGEFTHVAKAAAAAYRAHGSHAVAQALAGHDTRIAAIMQPAYIAVGRVFARRIFTAAAGKGRQSVLARKDDALDLDGMTEQDIDDQLLAFARRNAATQVQNVSKTTEKRIHNAIVRGERDDKTPDEIADDIEASTGGAIGSARAELIARTETHSAAQNGSIAAAKSLGLPLQKEWVAVNDDRTRDDHSEVDGTIIGIDDTFDVGDDELQYPGDPDGSPGEIVNCRCALVYHTDDNTDTTDESDQ